MQEGKPDRSGSDSRAEDTPRKVSQSRPTSGDREQQRADTDESRRQSGLEPLPRDEEPDAPAEDDRQ